MDFKDKVAEAKKVLSELLDSDNTEKISNVTAIIDGLQADYDKEVADKTSLGNKLVEVVRKTTFKSDENPADDDIGGKPTPSFEEEFSKNLKKNSK